MLIIEKGRELWKNVTKIQRGVMSHMGMEKVIEVRAGEYRLLEDALRNDRRVDVLFEAKGKRYIVKPSGEVMAGGTRYEPDRPGPMPAVTAGHGENFPHKFYACPHCGAKQLYIAKSGGTHVMLRCKSCKREKFIPVEQYTTDENEIKLFNVNLMPQVLWKKQGSNGDELAGLALPFSSVTVFDEGEKDEKSGHWLRWKGKLGNRTVIVTVYRVNLGATVLRSAFANSEAFVSKVINDRWITYAGAQREYMTSKVWWLTTFEDGVVTVEVRGIKGIQQRMLEDGFQNSVAYITVEGLEGSSDIVREHWILPQVSSDDLQKFNKVPPSAF